MAHGTRTDDGGVRCVAPSLHAAGRTRTVAHRFASGTLPDGVALLGAASIGASSLELGSAAFRAAWGRYARWLSTPGLDCTDEGEWVPPPAFVSEGEG